MTGDLTQYGPWSIVIGASEGLGAAHAEELAAAGLHVVLIARRADALEALATRLRAEYDVDVKTLVLDMSDAEAPRRIDEATNDLPIGLVVYNAAYSLIGPFLKHSEEDRRQEVAVNCVGPVAIARRFGERFKMRKARCALVLMSSLSGYQGAPLLANYAATKAYLQVLGEGLWEEWKPLGIDVLVCNAGATDTPNYRATNPKAGGRFVPATGEPRVVARETLARLGRGPTFIPGFQNRLSAFILTRILPRRWAVRILGRSLRDMYGDR